MSPANPPVPDLTIWDSIRDCGTASLSKLSSNIESEIDADKTLSALQKTASLHIGLQSRAQEWMKRAYTCCLTCWTEYSNRQETPEVRNAIFVYALYPFLTKEMLRFLRLAAGVSRESMSRLESSRSVLVQDHMALHHSSVVWTELFKNWPPALPSLGTSRNPAGAVDSPSRAERPPALPKAPPPITALSGTGAWRSPKRKPSEVPTDFPPDFPSTVALRARIIVAECVRAFPERSNLDRLCREIVSRSTDLLCTAARDGVLKAQAVPDRLNTLLHYVRVTNCENDNERYRIEKIVINSDEWLSMLTRLAECEELPSQPRKVASENQSANPKKRIETFIQTLQESGHKISKKDIWRVAGYADSTEFERFQRRDERTTSASEVNFGRVLNMSPETFMALLKKTERP